MAEADGIVYFTLDVGYIAGDESSPPAAPPAQGDNPGSTPASPPGTPVAAVMPVVASTPLPDGSIIHEVQSGQALWSISAIYKVSLPYLLTLNGLSEDTLIYPGDKILVRPPRATPTPNISPTPPASDTHIATLTPVKAQPTASRSSPSTQTARKQDQGLALAKAPNQGSPTRTRPPWRQPPCRGPPFRRQPFTPPRSRKIVPERESWQCRPRKGSTRS